MAGGGEIPKFHVADYVVFGIALFVCTAIGIVYGIIGMLRKRSAKDQMTGGKDMKAIPVSLSIMAAFQAAPFVLGTPSEIYLFGTTYIYIILGGCITVPIVAHLFVPLLHRLDLINGYQYFEKRFSKATRLSSSGIFLLMTYLYMAVVVYAPALAFSQVTDLSVATSILGVGVVATLYTTIGGLGAVIWIDVLQMMIIFTGLLLMAILGIIEVGGWSKIIDAAERGGRLRFNVFDVDPTVRATFWTQTIGGAALCTAVLGSNQNAIQKYISIRKVTDAQKTPYYCLLQFAVYVFLVFILGLTMYAQYEGCDPLLLGRVKQPDQIILLFMMEVLGHLHGIPGIFTAAVFCASLSTVSAGINAMSAVTLVDFVGPLYNRLRGQVMPEKVMLFSAKALIIIYGGLTVGGAFLAPLLGRTLLQIAYSVLGTVGAPLLGLMALGFLFPFANKWGGIAGLLSSLALGLVMSIGSIASGAGQAVTHASMLPRTVGQCPATDSENATTAVFDETMTTAAPPRAPPNPADEYNWLFRVSYMWAPVAALLTCFIVGSLVSLITRGWDTKDEVEPRLMMTPSCWYQPQEDTKDIKQGVNGLPSKTSVDGEYNPGFKASVENLNTYM